MAFELRARSVLGVVLCWLWMWFAIACVTPLYASLLLIPVIGVIRFKKFAYAVGQFYWYSSVIWVERFSGIRVVFKGDELPKRETAILMANHKSFTDWVILFTLACRAGRLGCMKFFAKNSVRFVPGIGWGMLMIDTPFLSRNWTKDMDSINRCFAALKRYQMPFWLVSFLEGTRLTKKKLALSQEFARKRNLPVLQHVLLPRVKGFCATIRGLRDEVDAVYDVTIGYENDAPPNLVDVSGWWNKGRAIHLHVKRFEIAELPREEDKLAQWAYDRFVAKEKLLDEFYRTGDFPGPALDLPRRLLSMDLDEYRARKIAAMEGSKDK